MEDGMKKFACRYAIVRFVPYAETGEFANVGIVLTCPQTGYFGFKLQTKKYARITAFFNELNGQIYRDAIRAIGTELDRIKLLVTEFEESNRPETIRQTFTHMVHPREAIIRFGEPRAILTDDPEGELKQLFNHYVDHSFADTEYIEHTMVKRLQTLLNSLHLEDPFRPAKLGDDMVYANFPLVQKCLDQPNKVIKPFNLNQSEPNSIYAHGDLWIPRIRRLRDRGLLPASTLFTVALPPQADAKRYEASQEIVRGLQMENVIVIQQSADDRIREFALA
jgi:hypothetical protein